jgi:glyoxylase-like metal-dependent hydrolase (beta-lactamase superfamily II)
MEIQVLPVGMIGTNCYILSRGKKALVIDPGGDADQIKAFLDGQGYTPLAILLTHAHYDHIGALEEIREAYGIEVYLHKEEQNWLQDPALNGSHKLMTGGIVAKEAENILNEGEYTIGDFQFEVIHTPGHSPGSMSFYFKAENQLFSGDVLFNQGIGRTDLPGGDYRVLEDTITKKLYQLEDHVMVHPGHGPSTEIGFEKMNNPFFHMN